MLPKNSFFVSLSLSLFSIRFDAPERIPPLASFGIRQMYFESSLDFYFLSENVANPPFSKKL